ncbi:hypothetical protein [Leucobacter sp. cx-169]|uniref:hypothetical protein n=1 Tax=Leucobacter sp. cx-169 TaxID=2770549 RepID=UPI00165D82B2|nr:hypothetical protein [Leucobacter sp. cx-169]MBC9927219.1 hypothetical protein [Leucobacter sp. cx-169]
MTIRNTWALPAIALAGALAFTGCSASTPEPTSPPPAAEQKEAPPAETATPAGAGNVPEWANGAVGLGDLIGGQKTASWNIEAFQVGTGVTAKDSMFVDAETNENLLPAGSKVVFVNFEYTNISDAPIGVGFGFGSPDVRSANWNFGIGQPGESSAAGFEAQGVSNELVKVGAAGDKQSFEVGPGETVSRAISIGYEPGVSAHARGFILTPVSADGVMDHDNSEQAEFDITIK